jgi:hypothetical protein
MQVEQAVVGEALDDDAVVQPRCIPLGLDLSIDTTTIY